MANLDRAPITFTPLQRENVFCTAAQFRDLIKSKYWHEAAVGMYRVLGAADFIGNPINLVANTGKDLREFVYLSATGLVKSPDAFVQGLTRGAESVLGHAAKGAIHSVGNITGALGKGFQVLAADAEFSATQDAMRNREAHGAQEGVEIGLIVLAHGIYSGPPGPTPTSANATTGQSRASSWVVGPAAWRKACSTACTSQRGGSGWRRHRCSAACAHATQSGAPARVTL